jgi:N-acyl-L-homoserine lactone synthetase
MNINQTTLNTPIQNLNVDLNHNHEIKKVLPSHRFRPNYETFDELNYQLKFQLKGKKLLDSYRLRAKVFCQELKWVGDNNTTFEIDEFDKISNHLGIINAKKDVVGTLRFTAHQHEWFMERYFPQLLPENFDKLKLPTSVEISRMAVENNIRACCNAEGKKIVDLLYKGIFQYCQARKITNTYLVVSTAIFRHFRMHRMPIRVISPVVVMPDGVKTVSAVLDWNTLYQSNNIKDQIFLEWLRGSTPRHNELLWQQPENGLSH